MECNSFLFFFHRLKSYSKSHYFAYPNKESPKSVKLLVNHFENVFSQAEESATSATDTIRQTNDSIDTDRHKTVAESSWTMIDSNDQPNGFTSNEFGSEIGSQSSSTDETDQRNAFPEIINDFEPNEEHEYSSREITIENIDQSTTESLESSCTNTNTAQTPTNQSNKRKSTGDSNENSGKRRKITGSNEAKRFQCELCAYSTSRKHDLTRHNRTHTKEMAFKCELCPKAFARNCQLKIHMRSHASQFQINCANCGQGFVSQESKDSHVKKCKTKRFECYLCGFQSFRKYSLVQHMRWHSGELPFQCAICERKFNRRKTLDDHMKTHADQFPFQCSNCRDGFHSEKEKKTHEKSCNRKNYRCQICKKYSTLKKRDFENHIRSHTGEKAYQCVHCPQRYSTKSHLNVHMKRHNILNTKAPANQTQFKRLKFPKVDNSKKEKIAQEKNCNQRTYECYLCHYLSSRKSDHVNHFRIHMVEKVTRCLQCSKPLSSEPNSHKHTRHTICNVPISEPQKQIFREICSI